MKSPPGKYTITFGVNPNFEKLAAARIMSIDCFRVGVSLGLVYDLSNSDDPFVKPVETYANSPEWAKICQRCRVPPPRQLIQ